LYASLVGVRATLGGLRDPDSVVEAEMAGRIRDQVEHLGESDKPHAVEDKTDIH
jgi:hypothetical protein